MAYQALARKYRPQRFSDIIGQETTVRTLQNAIQDQRIHHAYLFSGVRGVGKTTSARILAKCLNCVTGPTTEPCNVCTICREITEGIDLDVREIDAATYTGVDNVRELRDVSQFQPARDRYRIFIIDEAHMLSAGAWNALLKLIEEPPPHVIFMFATTEIHKVPQTIISRVQKQMLRKVTLEELVEQLGGIAKQEGIAVDDAALEIIARRGEGSVRDALSLLDLVISFSGKTVTAQDVATILGLSDTAFFARIVGNIAEGEHAQIIEALQEAANSGRDFKMLYRDLLNFVRNALLIAGGAREEMLGASPEDLATIKAAAQRFSYTELLRIANLLLRDDETVNRAEHQRLAVEIALLKAATFPRLRSVEEALAGGGSSEPRAAGGEQRAASRSTTSAAAPAKKTVAGEDPQAFISHVQSTRPLYGSYLAGAKSIRKEGNRITIEFDGAKSSFADMLTEQTGWLEEAATKLYGEATKVSIELAAAPAGGRRTEDKPSTLRDDPVIQSFAKHLGGEVVDSRKR